MKQADLGLNLASKRTRRREFLDDMSRVVPWADGALIEFGVYEVGKGMSKGLGTAIHCYLERARRERAFDLPSQRL